MYIDQCEIPVLERVRHDPVELAAHAQRISDDLALAPLLAVITSMKEDVKNRHPTVKVVTHKKGSIKETLVKDVVMYAHNYSGYDAFHCMSVWCRHAESQGMTVNMVIHKAKVYALDISWYVNSDTTRHKYTIRVRDSILLVQDSLDRMAGA